MVPSAVHAEKLNYHAADEDFALGVYGSVVIVVWRRETKIGAVATLSSDIAERSARYPGGVALLQVIEDTATPPSAATRRALAQMHGAHAANIRRSAVVYTKTGFAGASVRMVMTGVAMLRPPAFEHELFASVSVAIPWLEADLAEGAPFPPGALFAAVESVRAAARNAGTGGASERSVSRRKMSPRG